MSDVTQKTHAYACYNYKAFTRKCVRLLCTKILQRTRAFHKYNLVSCWLPKDEFNVP